MLLKTAEVAAFLGMTDAGVRKAARQGRLRCTVLEDGTRRFSREDVQRFAEARGASRGPELLGGGTSSGPGTGTSAAAEHYPDPRPEPPEPAATGTGHAEFPGLPAALVPATAELLSDPEIRPAWVRSLQRMADALAAEADQRAAAAELDLHRTEVALEQAQVEKTARARARKIDELITLVPGYCPEPDVNRACCAVRARLEELSAQQLESVTWLWLVPLVYDVVEQLHEQDRQRGLQLARQRRRAERIAAIVARLHAMLGAAIAHRPDVVHLGVRAATSALEQLDDRALSGSIWPEHIAGTAAAQALGATRPAPPWIRDAQGAWRLATPGD